MKYELCTSWNFNKKHYKFLSVTVSIQHSPYTNTRCTTGMIVDRDNMGCRWRNGDNKYCIFDCGQNGMNSFVKLDGNALLSAMLGKCLLYSWKYVTFASSMTTDLATTFCNRDCVGTDWVGIVFAFRRFVTYIKHVHAGEWSDFSCVHFNFAQRHDADHNRNFHYISGCLGDWIYFIDKANNTTVLRPFNWSTHGVAETNKCRRDTSNRIKVSNNAESSNHDQECCKSLLYTPDMYMKDDLNKCSHVEVEMSFKHAQTSSLSFTKYACAPNHWAPDENVRTAERQLPQVKNAVGLTPTGFWLMKGIQDNGTVVLTEQKTIAWLELFCPLPLLFWNSFFHTAFDTAETGPLLKFNFEKILISVYFSWPF